MMNLFKALSYKEWIKTRKIIGVLVVLAAAVLAYTFIEITHSIRLEGAVDVWYLFLFMNGSMTSVMLSFPLIAGLALALVQFVPEMVNKRLKLTLHLPAKETSIVASMLLYGYLVLFILFAITSVILVVGMSSIFSAEIVRTLLFRLLPCYESGLVAYGFTAWICFEPQWKQRILNLCIALGLLSVFFVSEYSGAYIHFGWGMLILVLVSFAFPFYSVLRFKHGVL